MIPIEKVDEVLLPLDQLHKAAREANVLRLPSQVFIPDELLLGFKARTSRSHPPR